MELLFESRQEIAGLSGAVRFIQTEPEVIPEPMLRPDRSWDRGGLGYHSTFKDGGTHRLWYQALPAEWDGTNAVGVAHADSEDGFTWKKPAHENPCNLRLHSPSVFLDPTSPSSHRYRAVGYGRTADLGGPADSPLHGFFTAHSADGFDWKLDAVEPRWDSADVVSAYYHPGRGQGTASVKMRGQRGGKVKRSIHNATYDNGAWSDPVAALIPDDFDEIAAISRGFASADYYSMGMTAGGRNSLVGLISQFRHSAPYSENGYGIFGVADISLAWQERPGAAWIHAPGRPDFVSHRSAPWCRGGIFGPGSVLSAGDKHLFTFSGQLKPHGWYLDQDRKVVESRRAQLMTTGTSTIGGATWPRDRMFGFRGEPEGYLDLNLPSGEHPIQLRLNHDCGSTGSLRVELFVLNPPREWQSPDQNLDGHSLDQAVPLTGNGFESLVTWNSGSSIPVVPGKRLLARIHLQDASVYAWSADPVPG